MTKAASSYNYEDALHFPLVPGAHRTAYRYMFDWAIAGDALQCEAGDLVLEFGAGPAYSSELLNRIGYRTVAVDIAPQIMSFAQARMAMDARLDPERSHFTVGDGQCLPFSDQVFDGVICLNTLHHMPDYRRALSEIRRVLKPGCRAVFSEPGSRHAESPDATLASQQYGDVERSIILGEIYQIARKVGFERMILKPYVHPHLVELDYRKLSLYRIHISRSPLTRPDQIARYMLEHHSIFALVTPGRKPLTSATPNDLRASIILSELPTCVVPGQEIVVLAAIKNTGDTLWLSTPREFGGHITFGTKLCLPNGRLLSDSLPRALLKQDVPPGGEIALQHTFQIPESLAPGDYLLRFDMVDERIAWFESLGSLAVEHRLSVASHSEQPSPTTDSNVPSRHRSRSGPHQALVKAAGAAIAEMGVPVASAHLLEPIARAIESLSIQKRQE